MRDQLRDEAYYNKYIGLTESAIASKQQKLGGYKDSGKAGCLFDIIMYAHAVIVMRYSRGDTVESMRKCIEKGHEMLQFRRRVMDGLQLDERTRHMWENLESGSLYRYLTLLAFMVSLRFPAEDILDVLRLVGYEGEDVLLELAAAHFGKEDAKVGQASTFPRVYGELVDLTRAEAKEQPGLLKKYVERWYRLNKPVYWHDTHKGAEGAYKGYWCFEAALVVMLLGIDDSQAQDHPHYPADLVRHYRQTA